MRSFLRRILRRWKASPRPRLSRGWACRPGEPKKVRRVKTRMSKPNVLVTGGAGYIGSHAVLALKDAGWNVSVIDDLSTGNRKVVPNDIAFFEGNIADRPLVDRILTEQQIGAIM